jgi:hypothetical protein
MRWGLSYCTLKNMNGAADGVCGAGLNLATPPLKGQVPELFI